LKINMSITFTSVIPLCRSKSARFFSRIIEGEMLSA
jgi:hypothetical protein